MDEPLNGGEVVNIKHARIVREPESFCSIDWLKHQAITTNWSNIVLLITLIVLSAQLTQQQYRMADQLTQAQQVSNENTMLLKSLADQATSLKQMNDTLNYAVASGLLNMTYLLSNVTTLSETVSFMGTQYLDTGYSLNAGQVIAGTWTYSTLSLTLPFPAVWQIGGFGSIGDTGGQYSPETTVFCTCIQFGTDPTCSYQNQASRTCISIGASSGTKEVMAVVSPVLVNTCPNGDGVGNIPKVSWWREGTGGSPTGFGRLFAHYVRPCTTNQA